MTRREILTATGATILATSVSNIAGAQGAPLPIVFVHGIAARTWPAKENHVTVIELTY